MAYFIDSPNYIRFNNTTGINYSTNNYIEKKKDQTRDGKRYRNGMPIGSRDEI